MAKGRKAIPSKIIELRGGTEHTHKKPREGEPDPPPKIPPCPGYLTYQAKKEWKRIVPLLSDVQLLSEMDMSSVAAYCQAYSDWVKAVQEIKKGPGMVYADDKGIPKLNPWVKLSKEAFDRMLKAGTLLGLSPSARVGLKVEKPKSDSKARKFMKRKTK